MKIELKINDRTFKMNWLNNFLYTLLGLVIVLSYVAFGCFTVVYLEIPKDTPLYYLSILYIDLTAFVIVWHWWFRK